MLTMLSEVGFQATYIWDSKKTLKHNRVHL